MQNQKEKFFSIIIPVYQVEQYLQECIESVLTQSFTDYEIILINDGSKDQSPKICDDYAAKYDFIHVIHKQNQGLSAARNDGIQKAKGTYVLFLDSDDTLIEEALMQLHQRIQAHPEVEVVTGLMDSEIVVKHTNQSNQPLSGLIFMKEEYEAQTMSNAACLYIYQKAFLTQHQLRFKVGVHHEDEDFTPKALLKAQALLPTDVMFYHYRVNEQSITTTKKNFDKNFRDLCGILKELEGLYGEVEDEATRKVLMQSLLEKYLYSFAKAKGYQEHLKDARMDDFVKHKAINLKNKLKVLLYLINKKWYCKLSGN